jgi:hypothetical protein
LSAVAATATLPETATAAAPAPTVAMKPRRVRPPPQAHSLSWSFFFTGSSLDWPAGDQAPVPEQNPLCRVMERCQTVRTDSFLTVKKRPCIMKNAY